MAKYDHGGGCACGLSEECDCGFQSPKAANDNRLDNRVQPCSAHATQPAEGQEDSLPLVVAISGAAGSGKSTAAQYLVERHGYTRVRFAGPLKAMMYAIGLSEFAIEGDGKEIPYMDFLCGKTPRHAMQTLGTEWGRKCIGEDFWIGLWRNAANTIIEAGGRVVVDDCRFPNEAAAVRKMGGDIYRLAGRGGIAGGHESERMDFTADVHIDNSGSVADLRRALIEALTRYA